MELNELHKQHKATKEELKKLSCAVAKFKVADNNRKLVHNLAVAGGTGNTYKARLFMDEYREAKENLFKVIGI